MAINTKHKTTGWEEKSARGTAPIDNQEFWNRRAKEYSEYAAWTGYPEAFIRIMRPRDSWTVLDMGCGGGTIAIPLARKVRSITAVDFSSRMLDIVRQRCADGGIRNIRTIQGRWEDDSETLGSGPYDVAIASRSLITDDAKGCILKLGKTARKAVYISTVVGSGPFDRKLLEATGRELTVGPDYIHYYNLLYEMGIMANVRFILEVHRSEWRSYEEAFEDQEWMFRGGMSEEERHKVHAYLREHLTRVGGQWRLPYSRRCYWAVMWWMT
ncbi:MAG: Mg-protoporphyrin IX methyl transferase [Syntrophorhabdus sp. PtaU1.Bin153]|nr:MAG: Mg-protoporphyrin IX methyl transferase [Syntrophorhabdus sp. PtaU1.Bin153]